MAFQDKTLPCSDCGATFVFTAGEQEFFQERGFGAPPKRCEDCRSKRKAEFNRSGSKSKSGTKSPSQKFPAQCSRCGTGFDAPFQPKEDRPVFCRDCFNASRGRH